jgi:hypothetical protein
VAGDFADELIGLGTLEECPIDDLEWQFTRRDTNQSELLTRLEILWYINLLVCLFSWGAETRRDVRSYSRLQTIYQPLCERTVY